MDVERDRYLRAAFAILSGGTVPNAEEVAAALTRSYEEDRYEQEAA